MHHRINVDVDRELVASRIRTEDMRKGPGHRDPFAVFHPIVAAIDKGARTPAIREQRAIGRVGIVPQFVYG